MGHTFKRKQKPGETVVTVKLPSALNPEPVDECDDCGTDEWGMEFCSECGVSVCADCYYEERHNEHDG